MLQTQEYLVKITLKTGNMWAKWENSPYGTKKLSYPRKKAQNH